MKKKNISSPSPDVLFLRHVTKHYTNVSLYLHIYISRKWKISRLDVQFQTKQEYIDWTGEL